MHCHVLPGVDDGPETMADSLEVLREAQRQGIGAMIVTPHFHPGRFIVHAARALEALEALRGVLRDEGIPIRLYPGQECYYHTELVGELRRGNALTMAGTDWVLLEFDPDALYAQMEYAVKELAGSGYRAIIAHYERYQCLYGREDRLEQLRGSGVKLQLNFDRLLERDSLLRRNPWRRHIRAGLVDFLGSDTHGMRFRPLRADRAVAWLNREVEPEIVRRVTRDNLRLLNVEPD